MTTFNPNCTLPAYEYPPTHNFVAVPNVRGTLNIVWSCLSVLILCSWSILHLDIPPQFHPKSKRQIFQRLLFLASQKLKWMLCALLAPEFIFAKAYLDLKSANVFQKPLEELAKADGVPWSLSHTFFANMGGFTLDFTLNADHEGNHPDIRHNSSPVTETWLEVDSLDQNDPVLDQLDGFRKKYRRRIITFGRLFGEMKWKPSARHTRMTNMIQSQLGYGIPSVGMSGSAHSLQNNLLAMEGDTWVLNAPQLLAARRLNIINCLPNVTEDEINDRNKGDSLVKGVTILQILWMIVQVFARIHYFGDISPLEAITVAHSVSAFITYCMIFYKPQSPGIPMYLQPSRLDFNSDDLKEILDVGPIHFWSFSDFPLPCIQFNSYPLATDPGKEGIDYAKEQTIWYDVVRAIGLAGISLCFLLGLSLIPIFPTNIERILFIVASYGMVFFPTFTLLVIIKLRFRPTDKKRQWYSPTLTPIAIFMLLGRLYIFVEVVRTLFFLPSTVYFATWAANLPHL